MWIVQLALRRPLTFIVMALLILLISPLAILRTPTDILPDINIPVISIIWGYKGLSAEEMSERMIYVSERTIPTTVSDIDHIESQSLDGIGVVKVFFQPNVDIPTALAQITAISQTAVRSMPPGTNQPFIIVYSASTVPIVQIGVSSSKVSEQELNDLGQNFIRPMLATINGLATPNPYGGRQRQIDVDLDTAALQAKGLTAVDVVNALAAQNLILPAGTAKIGGTEYNVEMNGSPQSIEELNNLPVRTVNGATIYLREVAHVRDGFAPQTNMVRQDGRRGILMSVMKLGGASTLSVVNDIKSILPRMKQILPDGVDIKLLFDQSIFVRAAVEDVIREAVMAACLTAGMVLLFLGNWRTTLIIAFSIPLSVLTSIIVLSALGETINIMTLGGLALAVGILVDDATVTIENIDRHLAMGKDLEHAILDGSQEIVTPAFVSTLCICIVFVPMFFLTGVARFLFVPLAEAVVFAMLASFVLSRTLVPTLIMYFLRGQRHRLHREHERGLFGRIQQGFENAFERLRTTYRELLGACLEHRAAFVTCFLGFCVLSLGIVFFLGSDFFPTVDAGQIRLHVRAPSGTRIEETARLCDEVEQTIRSNIAAGEVQTILDNLGLPYSGINTSYSTAGSIGTGDAEILVSLSPKHHPTLDYIRKLRRVLPQAYPGVEFFFQPADIVSQILNFGLPSPIDVQVVGRDLEDNYRIAEEIAARMRHVPGAVDVHVQQLMNQPGFHLEVNRTRAQQIGISAREVAENLLITLSSSAQTSPTYWLNPSNDVTYPVAVMTPQYKMDSIQALMNTPISGGSAQGPPQVLANLASLTPIVRAAVVSHYDIAPVVDVYAAVQGRDLGGVAADTARIVDSFKSRLPRGSLLHLRGQVETMASSFRGLGLGLVVAVVFVYLLIVVNFQSWLDPFIIITALPGALAGILWMLLLTGTTLNVPSLTGAVMCMGVATANSILVVSFARGRLAGGIPARQAALEAGYTRIRPVLMTALAMIIGMMPMALGFGEGGEQNAPLGRAVIGGLLFATVATLFFVPVVFSILHGRSKASRLAEAGSESMVTRGIES